MNVFTKEEARLLLGLRCVAMKPLRFERAEEIFRPENLTVTLKGDKKKIDADSLEKILKKLSDANKKQTR